MAQASPTVNLDDVAYQLANSHVNKGPHVLASCIAVSVLPLVAVLLRFWARRVGKSAWQADDFVIIVALVR